jgi:hypothetical protein
MRHGDIVEWSFTGSEWAETLLLLIGSGGMANYEFGREMALANIAGDLGAYKGLDIYDLEELRGCRDSEDVERKNDWGDGLSWDNEALGDLRPGEIEKIQEIVDSTGEGIVVVGGAAENRRRSPGSDLPFGKGPGTKSDIDYVILTDAQDTQWYKGETTTLEGWESAPGNWQLLPEIAHPPFPTRVNTSLPRIVFTPGEPPRYFPPEPW